MRGGGSNPIWAMPKCRGRQGIRVFPEGGLIFTRFVAEVSLNAGTKTDNTDTGVYQHHKELQSEVNEHISD